MRAIWKVRGLALLLQVGTLWRCSDSLFFEVSPLASDVLPTLPCPLLKNMLQTIGHFEISCSGSQKSHGVRSGLCGGCSDRVPPIHFFKAEHRIQFRSHPMVISGLFQLQPWKGSSKARNFKVINSLWHIFEKWVEHCKKCTVCQGRYSKKQTITASLQSSYSE
jgi:hypothetical protein